MLNKMIRSFTQLGLIISIMTTIMIASFFLKDELIKQFIYSAFILLGLYIIRSIPQKNTNA